MKLDFSKLSDPMKKPGDTGDNGDNQHLRGFQRPQVPKNSGDSGGQPPIKRDSSPVSPDRPPCWGHKNPSISAAVPVVPSVPAKKHANEIGDEAWCRGALAADPELRVAWRVDDDGASDPVRVVIAIRGKAAGVIAIPRARFDWWAVARTIGEIAEQHGG